MPDSSLDAKSFYNFKFDLKNVKNQRNEYSSLYLNIYSFILKLSTLIYKGIISVIDVHTRYAQTLLTSPNVRSIWPDKPVCISIRDIHDIIRKLKTKSTYERSI